jgi:hypothetical protein
LRHRWLGGISTSCKVEHFPEGETMFNLLDLDAQTRHFMRLEFHRDIAEGTLYISPRLSPAGQSVYANELLDAIEHGSPESLAAALDSPRFFNPTEPRESEDGADRGVRVPDTAAVTLAEGEFNRFYIRGLCRRAMANGIDRLVVYRAKAVDDPRSESRQRIGTLLDPAALLEDLRERVDTMFGVPTGPNSGLSVRIQGVDAA